MEPPPLGASAAAFSEPGESTWNFPCTPAHAKASHQNTDGPNKLVDNYVRGPFTDSGYASALGAIFMPRAALEPLPREGGDDETIYTGGTSVVEDRRHDHIQELANEIYFHLELEEHRERWEAISSHVATILKAFAIRAGSYFGTQPSRDTMRFIHKHSR